MKGTIENNETPIFNDTAVLIHPNDHYSVHVDISLTDYWLYIGNYDESKFFRQFEFMRH